MALERIVIQNFQSLKKVDIELGKFTVIVGASSSGKSAFVRAVKALASNLRGSSAITVGEKSMSISAYTTDNIITLQKTSTVGKYLLVDRNTGAEEKYTKLNQKVPEDITQALRIQPVTKDQASINFSGQHDLPYLLGDNVSASQVARVLGELTNVSAIFEAVREANRKKSSTNSLIKTRESDFDQIVSQADEFSSLKNRISYVETAETLLDEVLALDAKVVHLEELIAAYSQLEALLLTSRGRLEIPSLDELDQALMRYVTAKKEIFDLAMSQKSAQAALAQVQSARELEEKAHEDFHAKLYELGTCPTCGQDL